MENSEKQIRDKYNKITTELIEKRLSITTMESCTAGLIASLLTDTEGASAVMKGAFITYSNEAKILQGVEEAVIARYGVYSKETASAMAQACRNTYGADIGIGITGSFRNADPANEDSVPGMIYYAISCGQETRSFCCSIDEQPSRYCYKLYAAEQVADRLADFLEEIPAK